MTRSAARMHIPSAGARQTEASAGSTAGATRALELVTRFEWISRTVQSRKSQWETWVKSCTAEQRLILPVTEGNLISSIWLLSLARERETRRMGSSSIPQYLSAVCQMQFLLQENLFLHIRSFRLSFGLMLEEEKTIFLSMRCAVGYLLPLFTRYGL